MKSSKIKYDISPSSFEQKVILAQQTDTSIEVLIELKKEDKWQIDWALSVNPNTPLDILEEFYNRDDLFLRKRLARNLAAPNEFLEKLSKDSRYEIQDALLNNINTPVSALMNIIEKGDTYIRDRAKKIVARKLQELQKLWKT